MVMTTTHFIQHRDCYLLLAVVALGNRVRCLSAARGLWSFDCALHAVDRRQPCFEYRGVHPPVIHLSYVNKIYLGQVPFFSPK
jgi:hypothetical protein